MHRAEELQALVAGKMASGDVAIVILHVGDCERCRVRLRETGLDETTLHTIARSADTALGPSGSPKQADTPTTAGHPPKVGSDRPTAAATEYSFLGAPRPTTNWAAWASTASSACWAKGAWEPSSKPKTRSSAAAWRSRCSGKGSTKPFACGSCKRRRSPPVLASERIVTIHHVGEDRGCPYMVMELLEGESLDGRMKRVGPLPLADALRIAREAAEGLALAHDKGLIHRDIKPANVWLESRTTEASGYRVKLLDFGIARSIACDSHLTESGMIVGTPSYMCPEQAYGLPLDARSDLFSLGCLLYAMLAGDSPFARANTMLSIRAVAEEEAPVRKALPHLPAQLSTLVKRLLSKNPKDRPPHARSVIDELRCSELMAQPTANLPSGMPTALGREAVNTKKLGWKGWAGIAAVLAAALVGMWANIII